MIIEWPKYTLFIPSNILNYIKVVYCLFILLFTVIYIGCDEESRKKFEFRSRRSTNDEYCSLMGYFSTKPKSRSAYIIPTKSLPLEIDVSTKK